MYRFDLKDEAFQVYENIDKCSYLDDKEKPCVFGHQLPKLPSVNDIKRLAKGYGKCIKAGDWYMKVYL